MKNVILCVKLVLQAIIYQFLHFFKGNAFK